MTFGDVHWVELPSSNGREQRGRRPGLIWQDERYGGALPVVLVIPLTSARGALRFAGTVLVKPTTENGLRVASVALAFQLRAIDRRRILSRLGSVDANVIAEIRRELDELTGQTR